jgi:hypothetical protein
LPDWQQIGKRVLTAPGMLTVVIVTLWVGSGIAFPLWNRLSSSSQVGTTDFLVFLSSQVLHGLIAAAMTFVLLTLMSVHALYPRFLPEHEDTGATEKLQLVDRQLKWATSCLALIPLLSLLVLAPSEQADVQVFVTLAVVGFFGYLLTDIIAPKIRKTIHWLRRSLAPTQVLVKEYYSTL